MQTNVKRFFDRVSVSYCCILIYLVILVYVHVYIILVLHVLTSVEVITDLISTAGNAINSVRLSVRLFPLYLSNRLTFGLDLLHVCGSLPWLAWD